MMLRGAIAFITAMWALCSGAWAEKRVALVVGNGAYQHAATLANPVNDSRDMAAALSSLGFQLILGIDVDKRGLDLKVREFARALEGADVGLFFYAGHGVQVRGVNYLVTTDAKLEAERDLDFETVKVEFVLSQMERETKTNIVFLDACRNNPLAQNLARSMGTRGIDENNGLAPIKSGLGTFIAFATQPGAVASDGSGRNSPFTRALKKHIVASGASLTDVMIDVRKEVVESTKGAQVPWDHSALQGRFYFNITINLPPQAPTPAQPRQPVLTEASDEWSRVDKTSTVELETFVRRHGSSPEADYARSRLADLKKQVAATTPTPTPPPRLSAKPGPATSPTFEFDTDRPGSDYTNFDLSGADPALCASQCTQQERCLAWTYIKPGVQGPLARCWLKDRVPAAVVANFAVSGVRLTFDNPTVGSTPLDWCLHFSRDCGEPAASAWCRSRGMGSSASFVARPGVPITYVIGDGTVCKPGPNLRCDTFLSITCTPASARSGDGRPSSR